MQRHDEILITRGANQAFSRAVQRRAAAGELYKLATGIYSPEHDPEAQADIVHRHWQRIFGALIPGGVISHRSAFQGGLIENGSLFLSHPTQYNKAIKLPGVTANLVKGPGQLPGDGPLGDTGLYFASRPRQLLENLSRTRGARGRSAGAEAVEERLVSILNASGEVMLNRIRDEARELAAPLEMQDEFVKLDGLIGALLTTHSRGKLKTLAGKLVAQGTPVDAERMARFETLAASLRAAVLPQRPPVAIDTIARSNFAFLESYFSNYVEGTKFDIEEARSIALENQIVQSRPKDSHDILGVFQLALQSPWRDTPPPFGSDFVTELAARHALMMGARPEVNPGSFKLKINYAGTTEFVQPQFVRGTLAEGSLLAKSISEGLARAIFYGFLVSEVHPFEDGNGRLSRLIMNAELSRMGEARVIIPTLYHSEYVDCQRQLTRQNDPSGLVKAIALMQGWSCGFDYSDIARLIATVRATNALEESRGQFRLLAADGAGLGEID